MSDSAQPYVTENPEPRKPEVEVEEVQGSGSVPVYDADPTRLDLSTDYPERVSSASMDEVVGPDHPAAVIVPPEGRGDLAPVGFDPEAKTPEEALESGDADEATAVLDGETVTAGEAEQKS
jgi:hypothetical protein